MELLIILYLAYAHLVHPLETRQHYPLQLDRTDERVIAWEKSVQKYKKKRVEIDETEQQALRVVYHDIQVAYTNNQVEAMTRAMACVSNRVDCIQDALYQELTGCMKDFCFVQFLACKPRSDFISSTDFECFVALHTKVALFLGDCDCKRNNYDFFQTAWIEYSIFEVLKKYVERFHNEGKKDFEVIAQKYLDNWIAHIESDLGFIRRYAHFDMDRSRLAVQVGWISLSGARGGAFSGVVPLIKRGYTPKWVDEFYDADELRLKSIYRDIQSAYTNNQIEAMTQAMARVPAHFGRADGRPYFDGDKYLEIFFDDHFINDGISRRFDSLPEFARFLALNTEMALFLCNYDKDLSRTPIEPTELKRKTTKMLKGYVDELHREGRKDFERVAQKYLDIWTAHSVATPSLNWFNKFK